MKKLSLLLVALLCLSAFARAGEVISNDTGEDATGLRVSFSTPVLITAFGDILTSVDPQLLSFDFVFSGGVVEPWESHWFNYAPSTASVMETEWLTGSIASDIPQGGLTRDDLMNLGRAPSYEEIMSVIAEYPGPDEPIYVPAPDAAIWLTDLEGHADIYDNDSIRINYADWFDESRINEIEVYRNGVKMRFLPSRFDVLTNDQMKTFDGNSLEHTPSSAHTDHAIYGYEYSFRFVDSSSVETMGVTIRSPIQYAPKWYSANLLSWFFRTRDANYRDNDFLEFFSQLAALGYRGVSLDVTFFMMSLTANKIFPQYEIDSNVREWLATPTDEEIRRILSLVQEAGLEAEVRMQIWIANSFTRSNDPECDRSSIRPSNVTAFFDDYTTHAVNLARLADQEGADMFVPFVEMNSLEPYTEEIHKMLDDIDAVFGGRIAIAESTNHYLSGFSCYNSQTEFEVNVGKFWDWKDESGNPLVIGMDGWTPPMDNRDDQRFSIMLANAVEFWITAIAYFHDRYPSNELMFTEIGAFNFDGQARGWQGDPFSLAVERDDQEFADSWAVFMFLAELFELEGMDVWTTDILTQNCAGGRYYRIPSSCVLNTPAQRVITAMTLCDDQMAPSICARGRDSEAATVPLSDSSTASSDPTDSAQETAGVDNSEQHPGDSELPRRVKSQLQSTPQAIEVTGDQAFIVNWGTGLLQSMDPGTEDIWDLAENFTYVTDIASINGNLLIVNESGEAWVVDPATGNRSNYSLGVSISGEILGVEHSNDTLYLLVHQASGPKVIAIQDAESTSTPIQVGKAGELISLQLWKGKLLTLDYQAGIVFELVPGSSSYSLSEYIVLSDLVPIEEQADAGIRGMFLTDEAYYFTSVSFDGGQGKLHVVDVSN